MNVTYKVIDTRTNEDITNKYDWILQPNGRLAYNAYGDLIGLAYAEAVFNIEGTKQEHGNWIPAGDFHGDFYKCSNCGLSVHRELINQFKFCISCGAKMIKE